MAKQRSKTQSGAEEGSVAPAKKQANVRKSYVGGFAWPAWARLLSSLAIAFHVTAIFVAPWANQTEPALPPDFAVRGGPNVLRPADPPRDEDFQMPPLIAALANFFRPYLNATYTNHGYDFFTPDPIGSHIIGYDVLDERGKVILAGQFPDIKTQWPRLFYHRHMMLAAQLGRFDPYWTDMVGQELLQRHNGHRAHLYLLYHHLPLATEVDKGVALDASWLYETIREYDVNAGDGNFRAVPSDDRARVRIPGVAP